MFFTASNRRESLDATGARRDGAQPHRSFSRAPLLPQPAHSVCAYPGRHHPRAWRRSQTRPSHAGGSRSLRRVLKVLVDRGDILIVGGHGGQKNPFRYVLAEQQAAAPAGEAKRLTRPAARNLMVVTEGGREGRVTGPHAIFCRHRNSSAVEAGRAGFLNSGPAYC